MSEVGQTLRERRMALKIDVHEVEEATKIRAKYLRALENEEYDLLPGNSYVKSFLRTYAEYLGLDPRQLVDDYRAHGGRADDDPAPRVVQPSRAEGSGVRVAILVAVIAVAIVVAVLWLLLSGSS
jgi:cytoskeletal protein RodZ